jgi:hypothetical protein
MILHWDHGFLFATIYAKGGVAVKEYIARLIRTGMPRKVAVSVCKEIKRKHGETALAQYVDAVEEECDV